MGNQHALAKRRPVCRSRHFRGNAGEVAVRAAVFGIQYQRHQPRIRFTDFQAKLSSEIVPERTRAHFRDRKPSGRNHQCRCAELGRVGRDREPIRVAHFANPDAQKYFHAGRTAFRFQQSSDLVRRAVAKELAQRFFVISDAVLFHQGYKILRRVARQRRFREVRIRGDEILRPAVKIREIAAPAPRNQNFLSGSLRVLQDCDAPAAFPSLDRAQQSRGAGADDQHVKQFVGRFRSHF